MPAIDVHAHAFPDKLARRAVAALEAECPWRAVASGTVGALRKSMDAADIDISVVCSIATKTDQAENIFKWSKKIRCDRIEPLPSVHPETPQAAKWIEKFADEGFVGIKLHPMYQAFAFDEARLDDIYAACRDCGLFITAHCGLDIAFRPDDDRAAAVRIRRVVDRFPGLKLICTHMGGWRDWDDVDRCLIGADVLLETSFSLAELGPARAVSMMQRHGLDRVMMGSDWPWNTQAEELRAVRSLGLDAPTLDKVLWSNAARLLGY